VIFSKIRVRASSSLIITKPNQLAIDNWQSSIPGDILALHFGEVAEWLKAALC
jgi:hypothetical protein